MSQLRLFAWNDKNFPCVTQSHPKPSEVLQTLLFALTQFVLEAQPARVVCDLANNNLTFDHILCIAEWLTQPGRNIQLYALDLCFNRIHVPDWKTFLPLVQKLSERVELMEFGGNYLPAVLESDTVLQNPVFNRVSLTPPYRLLSGLEWQDSWTRKAHKFRLAAYGVPIDLYVLALL